jgi:hypothetical protein
MLVWGREDSTSRWLLLGGLMLLLGNGHAEASCVARFSFTFGQTSSGIMGADSGRPCAAHATANGGTVIRKVTVVAAPKNGTASAGGTGVTYRSKPAFAGDDSFTFTIFGDGKAGANTTATVQMSVNVK